ncbi:hypothetical protein EJB05_40422 [Eragrostis curvula]|uniref:Uncharacterized protein n=1 Tax=Eragrostis curvula TaxID=38414 RepID=A0A5J9TPX4_9POAL|nr:hypothetical protein EJB05_40422 [Eragrostis curvula]
MTEAGGDPFSPPPPCEFHLRASQGRHSTPILLRELGGCGAGLVCPRLHLRFHVLKFMDLVSGVRVQCLLCVEADGCVPNIWMDQEWRKLDKIPSSTMVVAFTNSQEYFAIPVFNQNP